MTQTKDRRLKNENDALGTLTRGEHDRFCQMAGLLYPRSRAQAVAGLMRTTPAYAAKVLDYQVPAHKPALARMEQLLAELERMQIDLLVDQGDVIIVQAGMTGPDESIACIRHPQPAVRTSYPWNECKPGDWFWIPYKMQGSQGIAQLVCLQNRKAGKRVWTHQHLLGGTRVDRLP